MFFSFGKKGYPLHPCQRLQILHMCHAQNTKVFCAFFAFRSFHPHPPDFPEVSYIMNLSSFLRSEKLGFGEKNQRKQQILREFPGRGDIKPIYIKIEDFDILQSFGACWRFWRGQPKTLRDRQPQKRFDAFCPPRITLQGAQTSPSLSQLGKCETQLLLKIVLWGLNWEVFQTKTPELHTCRIWGATLFRNLPLNMKGWWHHNRTTSSLLTSGCCWWYVPIQYQWKSQENQVPPSKLTFHLKRDQFIPFKKNMSSSNHQFSADILVFRGVLIFWSPFQNPSKGFESRFMITPNVLNTAKTHRAVCFLEETQPHPHEAPTIQPSVTSLRVAETDCQGASSHLRACCLSVRNDQTFVWFVEWLPATLLKKTRKTSLISPTKKAGTTHDTFESISDFRNLPEIGWGMDDFVPWRRRWRAGPSFLRAATKLLVQSYHLKIQNSISEVRST